MTFSPRAYDTEMRGLIAAAIRAWHALEPAARPPIFTVSIWTDPGAATSAVSIDTRDNSEQKVRQINDYNQRKYAFFLGEGDLEMAALFKERATRNCNPADFAFRELAVCRHEHFPDNWEEASGGTCWDQLEPSLNAAAIWACSEFRQLEIDREAELAINSRNDWYDTTRALDTPTSLESK